jgi:hypothetical protein
VRVEVRTKAALAGPAVADVVHLLAELIENAAVFSPPTAVVRVQGELVGRGFCVEVEDRGLGMAEEQLQEINHKLAAVPAFDPAGSDRLGLFVAGRLAHRHGISVALRSSVYGGTTAVVIIPTNLVITDETQVPAVTATRYALRQDAPVPALSGANGHGSNGHAQYGSGSNGHLGNGSGTGTDPFGIPPVPGTAAVDPLDPLAPSAMSGDSNWWARPTLAGNVAAESIPAGLAIGSATEVVPDPHGSPAPTIDENGGLPVRVRQASLAPQLREGTGTDSGKHVAATSAEAVRSTMSAMQRGWERGRSVAAESPDEPASHDPGTPKHGANHEEA